MKKKSKDTEQPKKGRPSIKTEAVLNNICDRLMLGESLRAICRDEVMPELSTVVRWLRDDAEFFMQYARAREVQMELMSEEILEIADDSANDKKIVFVGNEAKQEEDREVTGRAKLRVDARKWIMSKMASKRFGDKLALDHSGSVEVKKVEIEIIKPKTE